MILLQAREKQLEVELSVTDMVMRNNMLYLMIQGPRDKISLYSNLFLRMQEVVFLTSTTPR